MKPKFQVGDIVRLGEGPTALMQITDVVTYNDLEAGGFKCRYYGQHCMGASSGAFADECSPASDFDLDTWKAKAEWRNLGGKKL